MRLIHLGEVDSTQNYIKLHPELSPRTAVLASRQTAGRGRLGRSFASPENLGMYLSVVLPPDTQNITPIAAVAGRKALARAQVDCGIKWVNDLVVERGGAFRKLCGILAELSGGRLILGVGIDIGQRERDFPPELRPICTSVALEGGRTVTPREMAEIFLEELDRTLALDADALYDEYSAHCVTIGRAVEVKRVPSDPGRPAVAVALDRDFAVEVAYPDGEREVVFSGEASLRLG